MPTATVDTTTGEVLEEDLSSVLRGTSLDPDRRQMALPGFEGHRIHRIVVKVAGSVELNPNDSDDIALFQSLTLGQHVEFTVSGRVISRPHGLKPTKMTVFEDGVEREGIVDVVTSVAGVKVTGVSE